MFNKYGFKLDIKRMVYPRLCPVCQELLSFGTGQMVHKSCYKQLKRVISPVCKKCGKPVMSVQQEYCFDCSRHPGSYECGHGLWVYDAVSSASVFGCKYGGKRYFTDFYVENLCHFYGSWVRGLQVDCLVPVPISRYKLKLRGFNQSGLLAEGMGERLNIPVNLDGLARIHDTQAQKGLGREERKQNLKRAFVADSESFHNINRVLLIDDIYTTGSTIEYCTRALMAAGVSKVWYLAVCIGSDT